MKSIPSFLVTNRGDEAIAEIAKWLIRTGPAAKEDWGREIAYLRTFGRNFFGRAGCGIREYYNEQKAKDATGVPAFEHSHLTSALFDEWWSTVTSVGYCGAALATLCSMWNGAGSILPDHMKKDTVPLRAVIDFLIANKLDCGVVLRKWQDA